MVYQPRIDNFDSVPQAEPGALLFSTRHGVVGVASVFDAAGNKFVVVQINVAQSNDSFAYVRKYNPQGQFVDHRRFPLYNFDKHDAVSVSHSGRDLVIIHSGHDTPTPLPPEGRENPVTESRWVGVYEPFPGLSTEQGGASVFSPVPNPDPNPDPGGDPGEVVQAIADALWDPSSDLSGAMSKLVKNNSQIGTARAMADPSVDPFIVDEGELDAKVKQIFAGTTDFYSSPGVYARLDQTIYGTVNKVLDERGLSPESIRQIVSEVVTGLLAARETVDGEE